LAQPDLVTPKKKEIHFAGSTRMPYLANIFKQNFTGK
jgi:hypothetical protein